MESSLTCRDYSRNFVNLRHDWPHISVSSILPYLPYLHIILYLYIRIIIGKVLFEAFVAQGHKRATVKRDSCEFDSNSGEWNI